MWLSPVNYVGDDKRGDGRELRAKDASKVPWPEGLDLASIAAGTLSRFRSPLAWLAWLRRRGFADLGYRGFADDAGRLDECRLSFAASVPVQEKI